MKALLLICFTAWAIATEYLVVDLIKFNAKAEILEDAARALRPTGSPHSDQPSIEIPGGAKFQHL
jgi:hypothetical protein